MTSIHAREDDAHHHEYVPYDIVWLKTELDLPICFPGVTRSAHRARGYSAIIHLMVRNLGPEFVLRGEPTYQSACGKAKVPSAYAVPRVSGKGATGITCPRCLAVIAKAGGMPGISTILTREPTILAQIGARWMWPMSLDDHLEREAPVDPARRPQGVAGAGRGTLGKHVHLMLPTPNGLYGWTLCHQHRQLDHPNRATNVSPARTSERLRYPCKFCLKKIEQIVGLEAINSLIRTQAEVFPASNKP